LALLFCHPAFAKGEKALFFEPAMAPADTTFSAGPQGFSKLVDTLTADGMLVASMSSGEISRNKLSPYEIVVIHPSPERPLEESEISALVGFVAQQGGSLFVHGGSAEIVNPLTEIFGISMDSSALVDPTSALEGSPDGRSFVITEFPSSQEADFGFDGVENIGFYGGPPLILSRDAIAIVAGDADCYSDSGLYSIGSSPPVAALAYLGRGAILVKSDRSVSNNTNIETHQNLEWTKRVFRRLATIQATGLEREESMIGLRSRLAKISNKQDVLVEQRVKSESDLATQYKKIKELRKELQESESGNEALSAELGGLISEKESLAEKLAFYESADTLKIAAAVAGALLLIAFLIGIRIGRRTMRGRV
jgi:hypothetical protein